MIDRLVLVAAIGGLLLATHTNEAEPQAPARTDPAVDDAPIYKLRTDFVVPEGPAFKLVSIDEASILRPSSVRELNLSAANFTGDDGSFAFPTQFGIEAAPFLLANGRSLTRSNYQKMAWLYRTRVSVASRLSKQTHRPTALALGIRGTLVDHADVRLDDTLALRVLDNLRLQHAVYVAAATRVNPFERLNSSTYDIPLSAQEQSRVDSLDRALAKVIAQREEEQWNATAADFALAVSGSAADEQASSMRFQETSAWLTYARRAGEHGQFLIGGRAGSKRDSISGDMRGSIIGSSRLYLGTHTYKAFVEGQFGAEKDQKYAPWFVNSGGEVRFANSLWAEFSAGVTRTADERKAKFATRFKLHTSVPKAISGN